jgi:hypothetical protein
VETLVKRHRILILPTAALAVMLAISACSPSASTAPTASSAPSPGASTGAPAGGLGGGDFAKIQQCLQAAGISLPTGSFAPPGGSFAPPDGSFALPSGAFPSGRIPNGSFNPGGLGAGLSDPKIQTALKACGLSLPGGSPAPSN